MTVELDDLAQDAIQATPTKVPDVSWYHKRVKRRRQRRQAVSGLACFAILGGAIAGGATLFDQERSANVSAADADGTAANETSTSDNSTNEDSANNSQSEIEVLMPDVAGMTEEEATAVLEAAGFTVIVRPEEDPTVEPGIVVRTSAEAGAVSKTMVADLFVAMVPMVPSQSSDNGARDFIPSLLASLQMSMRVSPEVIDNGPSVDTTEGTWVISRPDEEILEQLLDFGSGCIEDHPSNLARHEKICSTNYAEILLLSAEGEILKAYPFPEVPPTDLQVVDNTLYCSRAADADIAYSMLCRIDLDTKEALVRVFPLEGEDDGDHDWWRPIFWEMDQPNSLALWNQMNSSDATIEISGPDGSATVDPETLELITVTPR